MSESQSQESFDVGLALRDRIAAALGGQQWINLLGNGYDEDDLLELADAVIAALPTEPSDAGERLDCIGRWMKPSLWSALDGRREAILRILKGEIVEPPNW